MTLEGRLVLAGNPQRPTALALLAFAVTVTVVGVAVVGAYILVRGDNAGGNAASFESSVSGSASDTSSNSSGSHAATSVSAGVAADELPMSLEPVTVTYKIERVDDIGEHSATIQMTYREPSDWISTVIDSNDKSVIGSSRTYKGATLLSFDARTGIAHETEIDSLLPTDGFYHPQLEFLLGQGTALTLADAAGQLAFESEDIKTLSEPTDLAPVGTMTFTRFTADTLAGENVTEEYTYDLKTGLLLSRVTMVNGELLERIDAVSYTAE